MARVAPFHSSLKKDVHHVCSNCTEGNNIESRYRQEGTGGLPLCKRCSELSQQGKC
jgi:hypothetical protein